MRFLQILLSNWPGWLGLGATFTSLAALIAGASWIPGVGTLLTLLTSGLQMIAPLISGLFSGFIWIWSKVLWPGILDIVDSWATIMTVAIMGAFLWFGFAARYEVQHVKDKYTINKCLPKDIQEPETSFELPWPFNWK